MVVMSKRMTANPNAIPILADLKAFFDASTAAAVCPDS